MSYIRCQDSTLAKPGIRYNQTPNNYGKVRNFLENHPGATINQVMAGTGVSKASIKQLIADDRIQRRPYAKGTDDDDII